MLATECSLVAGLGLRLDLMFSWRVVMHTYYLYLVLSVVTVIFQMPVLCRRMRGATLKLDRFCVFQSETQDVT